MADEDTRCANHRSTRALVTSSDSTRFVVSRDGTGRCAILRIFTRRRHQVPMTIDFALCLQASRTMKSFQKLEEHALAWCRTRSRNQGIRNCGCGRHGHQSLLSLMSRRSAGPELPDRLGCDVPRSEDAGLEFYTSLCGSGARAIGGSPVSQIARSTLEFCKPQDLRAMTSWHLGSPFAARLPTSKSTLRPYVHSLLFR